MIEQLGGASGSLEVDEPQSFDSLFIDDDDDDDDDDEVEPQLEDYENIEDSEWAGEDIDDGT